MLNVHRGVGASAQAAFSMNGPLTSLSAATIVDLPALVSKTCISLVRHADTRTTVTMITAMIFPSLSFSFNLLSSHENHLLIA